MALEGIELCKVNRRGVTILTTEGRVRYERWMLRPADGKSAALLEARGASSVYPLDEFLGLDGAPFKMTCDAALLIARVGTSSGSYKDAARELTELHGVPVGATTVRRVTDSVGSAVLERDRGLAASLAEGWDPGSMRFGHVRGRIPKAALTLYLQMDGAMLDTRGGGRGEVRLAISFRSDELVEVAAADGGTVGYRLGRRSYAASVDGIEDFRALLLPLVEGAGIADAHNVVILGDGAPWIRNTRDLLFPSAVLILDLSRLKENVGEFARFLFTDDEARASEWATGCNDMLERGGWREFLRLDEVARYKDEDTPKGVVNIYRYVWNNRDAIDYPRYVARGYFVGSGAIESANRTVMQKRIKQPGMRWREDGAGGVLTLRCKLLSGSWQADVVDLIRDTYTESA